MLELESVIKELELKINTNNSSEAHRKLAVLKARYNMISANKASAIFIRLRQACYDRGENAGKFVAWHIKTLQNKRTINEITNTNGDKRPNPPKMYALFESYCSNLYPLERHIITESLNTYFDQVEISLLGTEAKAVLESPITKNELSDVIDKMKEGNAPGPEGIQIDVFKISIRNVGG